jgi:hypothetical protein
VKAGSCKLCQVNSFEFLAIVRPAKAGMFSGRQSHRDKSQDPVAWIASVEETKLMKAIDEAIFRNGKRVTGPQRE